MLIEYDMQTHVEEVGWLRPMLAESADQALVTLRPRMREVKPL